MFTIGGTNSYRTTLAPPTDQNTLLVSLSKSWDLFLYKNKKQDGQTLQMVAMLNLGTLAYHA